MERQAKQVIVMRKDLNMRKGKMVAQGSHASLGALLSLQTGKTETELTISLANPAVVAWLSGRFTKICVSVDSESELIELYQKARSLRLPASLITDAGLTEFAGVLTVTCCAIGPAWPEDVDKLTGKLPLL